MDPEETTTKQPETDANATAADTGPEKPRPATFTQEQLDAIVKDRLERATKKTTADLLNDLGVDDLETAKKTFADAQKAREAQMSELERVQAKVAEAEALAAQATTEAEAIKAQAAEAMLKAAIISKAGDFHNSNDAWLYIDQSKIKVDDDGAYTGIDEALKALIEEQPYRVKTDNGQPGPGTPARAKQKTIVEKLLENQKNQGANEEKRPSTIRF